MLFLRVPYKLSDGVILPPNSLQKNEMFEPAVLEYMLKTGMVTEVTDTAVNSLSEFYFDPEVITDKPKRKKRSK